MNQSRANTRQRLRFLVRSELQRELARLNLSQNRLARKCRISSGYMSQLLTGERAPGPEVRKRLLSALPTLTFDQMFVEGEGRGGGL